MKKRLLAGVVLFVSCSFAWQSGAQTPNVERARTILREGIESKDPNIRIQAIVSASMIGNNELVVKHLETALQDKDVQVRIAAIRALTDLKAVGSAPALEKTLKEDEVPEVSFAAARALYALKDPAGRRALMEVFEGKINPNSNYFKKKGRSLTRNFFSVKSTAMFVVSQGIGFVPIPGAGEGLAAMTELLSDPELSPRATVVLLLGKEKTPEAVDLIKRSMKDSDWSVRAAGAQIIANTARTDLRELLVPLFDDKKEKVRFRAAGAYLHLYLQRK